jgi:exopolysaccharide biosynthesis polyprenyl glycosylphosphotransferase
MARRVLAISGALDVAALIIALEVGSLVAFGTPFPWEFRSDVWALLVAMGGGALAGLFVTNRTAGSAAPRPSFGRAFSIVGLALAVTGLALVFSRAYWSRNFLAVSTLSWLALALAHRALRRRRPWTERMVLITNEKSLIDDLRDAPHVDLVTVLDPSGSQPDRPLDMGTTLVVDLRAVLSDEMARFVSSSNLAGYPMRSLVSAYEEHTGRLAIVHLLEGWELTVPLSTSALYVQSKRVGDLFLVLLTAPLALVMGLVIALAIRLDSRGPVIFKQRRIGKEGEPFTLYKFRTMHVHHEDGTPRFARHGDHRLTRVGRMLRKVRLDELPQLWNVVRGDLSLVGPRPEQGPFVERFSDTIPFYTHRHLVRPGITGWAQVNFGYADNDADTIEKLSFDLYYVKHLSPWLDLEILGRSVWTVLSGYGAR